MQLDRFFHTNTYHPKQNRSDLFLTHQTILPILLLLLLTMASNMPNFVSRLFRPFASSSSLSVVPGETGSAATSASAFPEGAEKCTVAAGCFWGVEHIFRKKFGNGGGVLDAQVGYIGGDIEQPGYRRVCRGDTGREFRPPESLVLLLFWGDPFLHFIMSNILVLLADS